MMQSQRLPAASGAVRSQTGAKPSLSNRTSIPNSSRRHIVLARVAAQDQVRVIGGIRSSQRVWGLPIGGINCCQHVRGSGRSMRAADVAAVRSLPPEKANARQHPLRARRTLKSNLRPLCSIAAGWGVLRVQRQPINNRAHKL